MIHSMNPKVIDWLLEDDNPPIKYLTLTQLLGNADIDPQVREAKANLMNYDVTVETIMRGREYWEREDKSYWKYTGQYWQLIFLGQFLANGRDKRLGEWVIRLIEKEDWVYPKGGQCLTANMLSAFIRLGFGDHDIVRKNVETLAERTIKDNGVMCEVMDYSLLSRCYMSTPKLLLCFGLIPEEFRSTKICQAIDLIVQNLIEHQVNVYVPGNHIQWKHVLETAPKRAELPEGQTVKHWIKERKKEFLHHYGPGDRVSKPGWSRFGFPLHYNSDILEAMYALVMVDCPYQPELSHPLEVIRNKCNSEEKWIMENSLNGKMLVDVEEKGKPSKWLTFFALKVLDHFDKSSS